MSLFTTRRVAFFVLLLATFALAADKPTPTYLKGTIKGWDTRLDTWSMSSNSNKRRATVYELKGPDLVYQIDYCGAFQAGKFTAGQQVDYRVEDKRLYIRRDDGKEYGCKIEGTKTVDEPKIDTTKPDAPKTDAPSTPQ
jgi:hypothetical protein